jgi:hypothetical protein
MQNGQLTIFVKSHFEAENKAKYLDELLGVAAALLDRLENLVCGVDDVALLVVQVIEDLKLTLGDFGELSGGCEWNDSLPEIDGRCRPVVTQNTRQIGAASTKISLSGVCQHSGKHTACWN